jgi:hypothetical protein
MGSDMYMAQQSYRPGPRKVYWDKGDLVIEQDYFPDGYTEVYRGSADSTEGQAILKAFGVKIPPKPNTLVSYRLDFEYLASGSVGLQLNTTYYPTHDEVLQALKDAAAERYSIEPRAIRSPKVKVIE